MARIRTIKPEFFKHEGLFDAEVETGLPLRVAFAGLWTVCDKAGRFEWRPRALKTDVLPYDDLDFSRVLDALVTRGFVVKYRVDGKDYGEVPGFSRHQVINNRETESKLPSSSEAAENSEESTRAARVLDALVTRQVRAQGEGEREGEREGEEDVVSLRSTTSARAPEKPGAETGEADPEGEPVVVDEQGKPRAGHQPIDVINHWQVIQSMLGCSGSIRPDGKLMNATTDQAEIPKWDRMGISRAEQLAVIADMLAKRRHKAPSFVPNGYGWMTAGLESYVEHRDANPATAHKPPEQPLPPELSIEKSQIDAEWQRLADQHGPEADAARQVLIDRMRQIRERAAA